MNVAWLLAAFIESEVKVTWHTTKYGDPYSEFVLCIYHPKCTHTAVNTHTPWTHTRAVGCHLCCSARGSVGVRCPCSRAPQSWYWGWRERCTFTPPHLQSLPDRDSNSQPFDYESDSLTIRPRLPYCHSNLHSTANLLRGRLCSGLEISNWNWTNQMWAKWHVWHKKKVTPPVSLPTN